VQVAGECARLMRYKRNIVVLPVYGGQPIERQIEMLRGSTPGHRHSGRILDHLERKTLSLKGITMVVLDEADEMLDMVLATISIQSLSPSRQAANGVFLRDHARRFPYHDKRYMVEPQMVKVAGNP